MPAERLCRTSREARQEKIGEVGNVFFVFAQRRDVDGHDIQPVVEILAKGAFFERGAQIAIGGGDQAHVHFDRARAAEPLEFALLQNAQQLHLRGRRNVADFIEKQRALVGQFEFSGLAGGRAGEGALFVAEEFAFQKIFGDRGAVDFDEGPGGAAGALVDACGDQILAHAAFAAEQNRGMRRRDALDQGQHFLHFRAVRDDVGILVALAQGFAQRAVFFAQAADIELLVHHHAHFREGKRLQHVIAGAGFHGFDGGFHGAEGGHDDHGQGGVAVRLAACRNSRPLMPGSFRSVRTRSTGSWRRRSGRLRHRPRKAFESRLRRDRARAGGACWLRLRRSEWWAWR